MAEYSLQQEIDEPESENNDLSRLRQFQERFLSTARRFIRILQLLLAVVTAFLVWISLIVLLPAIDRQLLTNSLRGAIILIGGFLPAIIFGYFQSRRQILFVEYKQNLRRLGFIENAQIYRKKFDAIYGNTDLSDRASILFQTPIIVATLLSIVGWIIVFYPPIEELSSLTPNATTLAYGFLGAYVFAIGSLVRQYVTDDLQQRYYASIVYRYIAIFVLSGLITFIFPGNPSGAILSLAFTFGFFPSMGIRLIVRVGTNLMNSVSRAQVEGFEDEHPLHLLQGPNAYHEDRLLLEGIENIQNLACVDIVDLMLKTRFSVEQLVDWIDQSLLYLHTGREYLPYFRSKGVRTATDFIDIYDYNESADTINKIGLLDAGTPLTLGQITNIAVALRNDPNMYHVRYWRDHQFELLTEDIVLTKEANLKFMRGFPEEAITLYDELIRQFPNYNQGHFYRGLANAAAKKYNKASDDFRTALALAGPSWELASSTRLELGKALQNLGQLEEAADVYQEAVNLDEGFVEGHLAYAELQLFLKQYQDAIDHLKVAVEQNFRKAESSANLGLAQFEQWKITDVPPQEKEPLLLEARKSLEQAIKLKPALLPAYLNLASIFEVLGDKEKAIDTFTGLIERPESDTDRQAAYLARLKRGNLYFESDQNRLAVVDYQDAVNLSPSPVGYFNLGQAHARINQPELALDAFQHAVHLNNKYLEAYQRMGEVALQIKKYNEAIAAYNQEIKLHEDGGNLAGQMIAHLNLGRAFRLSGNRYQEAQREFKLAANLSSKLGDDSLFTTITYEIGLTHFEANEMAEAIDIFANAAEIFDIDGEIRQSVEARIYLARALTAQGRTVEAQKELDLAEQQLADEGTQLDPTNLEDIRLKNEIAALRPSPRRNP